MSKTLAAIGFDPLLECFAIFTYFCHFPMYSVRGLCLVLNGEVGSRCKFRLGTVLVAW